MQSIAKKTYETNRLGQTSLTYSADKYVVGSMRY